jgi:hypothetical protein
MAARPIIFLCRYPLPEATAAVACTSLKALDKQGKAAAQAYDAIGGTGVQRYSDTA